MKKINIFLISLVIVILLSIAVFSLSPIINIVKKVNQITSTISLEEEDICTTIFYDEVIDVISNCTEYHNYTHCLNTSGPNTDCSFEQEEKIYECKTGEFIVERNSTECRPNDKFIISIDKGAATLKKQIDYSKWGPCVYEAQNNCLVVTCVSYNDGAHLGKFVDCKGGKSCEKFEICDESIKILYKNSREDFVENDPSFFLPKLAMEEVGK